MSISQSERRKRPAVHPLARPETRSFRTFRNLSFDRSTTEDKPLYLTSFTGKRSSQSQGKGHCQLLPKDWKTASHALTGDPLAPQQPPVAMGRHYAYAPLWRSGARLRKEASSVTSEDNQMTRQTENDTTCFTRCAGLFQYCKKNPSKSNI